MKVLACGAAMVILAACGGGTKSDVPNVTTLSPDGTRYTAPSYSPDGKHIAYWTPISDGLQLWVANADLSNPVKLPVIGNNNAPIWSPDGSQLAVVSTEYGPAHAVVVPASGGSARRLTTGTSVDLPTGWFPDGDRVAYAAFAAGGTVSGFVTSLQTGKSRSLVPGEKRPFVGLPSPDGTHIAYQVIEGPKTTIWVADSAGANGRQLTTEGFEVLGSNISGWSPDGKEVVYESRRTGTADVWVVPIDGGPARQLTRDVRNDYAPFWSSDGKWIAFLSDRGRQTDIWVMPSPGGEEHRVTDTPEREGTQLAWRPGTSELTFVNWTQRAATWAMDVATGAERRLTPDSLRVTWFNVSPDANSVDVVIDRGGNLQDLAVVPMAGGEIRTLVTGGNVNEPLWSPDGTKIVFTSDRAGSQDVWVVDAAGGAARQLVSWPGGEWAARWSGDGKAVAFLSDHDSKFGDVWTVPVSGGEPTRVTHDGTVGGNLVSRAGVADVFAGVLNPAGGQQVFVRVSPDGRTNMVWSQTNAYPDVISPSGDSIAAEVEQPDGKMRTMILPSAGGTGRVILGANENSAGLGSWSRDGKSFLYEVNVDGAKDIGILNLVDGTKRRLTTTPENEDGTEFSPDGKTVVFQRTTSIARLTNANLAAMLGGR